MTRIKLHTGQYANFPDEMSHEDIEKTLQSHFNFQPKQDENQMPVNEPSYERTGLGEVGKDIANSLVSAPGAGIKAIEGIPDWLMNIGKYRQEKGLMKSLGQTGIGAAEGTAALLSGPQILARYIAEKSTGDKHTRFHNAPTPYELLQQGESALGLNAQSEPEKAIRSTGQFIIPGGAATKTGRAALFGGMAGGQGQDPLHAALASYVGEGAINKAGKISKSIPKLRENRQDIKNIADIENAAKEAEQTYNLNQNDLQIFKDELTKEFGIDTPKAFQNAIRKQENTVNENIPNASIPIQNQEWLQEPEQPQNNIPQINQQIQDIGTKIQPHLFHRNEPDVIASHNIVNDFNEQYKNIAHGIYNQIEEDIKDESVAVPARFNPKKSIDDLESLINTEGWGTTQAASLKKALASMKKDQVIPAKDFYSAFRQARQTSTATRNASYGKPAEEFDRLQEKADKLDEQADDMAAILEKTEFGPKVLEDLSSANSMWRTVKQVEKNSLYKSMANKGRVEGGILPKLRGTESGVDVLNQLVQSNPETLHATFGSSYAERPHEMANMSARERALAKKSPELSLYLDNLEKFNRQHENETRQQPILQQRYEALRKRFEAAQKREVERKESNQAINKAKKQITKYELELRRLKSEMSKTGLSKQKSEALKQRFDEVTANKNKIKKLMRDVLIIVGSAVAGNKAVGILNKFIK